MQHSQIYSRVWKEVTCSLPVSALRTLLSTPIRYYNIRNQTALSNGMGRAKGNPPRALQWEASSPTPQEVFRNYVDFFRSPWKLKKSRPLWERWGCTARQGSRGNKRYLSRSCKPGVRKVAFGFKIVFCSQTGMTMVILQAMVQPMVPRSNRITWFQFISSILIWWVQQGQLRTCVRSIM